MSISIVDIKCIERPAKERSTITSTFVEGKQSARPTKSDGTATGQQPGPTGLRTRPHVKICAAKQRKGIWEIPQK